MAKPISLTREELSSLMKGEVSKLSSRKKRLCLEAVLQVELFIHRTSRRVGITREEKARLKHVETFLDRKLQVLSKSLGVHNPNVLAQHK